MMATIPHVTSGLRLRKFQADGFLLTRVYLVILCVAFHVLHTDTMADLTLLLKVLNFFAVNISLAFHTE